MQHAHQNRPHHILHRIQIKYNNLNILHLYEERFKLKLRVLIRFNYSDKTYKLNICFANSTSTQVYIPVFNFS